MSAKGTLSRDEAHVIDLRLNILTPVPDVSTVKLMELTCNLLEPRQLLMGLVARKPVFGVSEKASFKPVSSAAETS